MSDAARIVLRLGLGRNEPAHGYLLRLSSRYRVPPSKLASRLQLQGLTVGKNLQRLATLARLEIDDLREHSPVVHARARRVSLNGESLFLSDWSLASRRWCPVCLHADRIAGPLRPYQRSWWDVQSVTVCPIHRVSLSDRCGSCGIRTTWKDLSVARCRCGARLSTDQAEQWTDYDMLWSTYVAARLAAPIDRLLVPAADTLPLATLTGELGRLGLALSGKWMPKPSEMAGAVGERQRSAALRTISDLKPPLFAALDQMMLGYGDRPNGLIGAYGWIYTHWLSQGSGDELGVTPFVREHAIARGIIAPDEHVLGGNAAATLSISDLRRRWGCGFDVAKRAMNSEGQIPCSLRRGVSAVIPEAAALRLERAWSSHMAPQAVRERLGIERKALSGLVSAGILQRSSDGSFDRLEVETLVERLVSGSSRAGKRMPLITAARAGSGSVAALCEKVLKGQIRASALVRPAKLLCHVGISVDDVTRFRPARDLSIRGIARTLGLREDVTRYLRSIGVLSDRSDGNPTANGISLFARDFVTAIELGQRTGRSPRAVLLQLRDLDIAPAFAPPECRQVIYRRDKAERALFAAWGGTPHDLARPPGRTLPN